MRRVLGWAVLAGLLGGLINLRPIPAWNGTLLLFGGLPVVVVALRCGPVAGMLAAVLAWLPPVLRLQSPVLMALAVGEAFVIGRARDRSVRAQCGRVVSYWVLVAAPVGWAWYQGVRLMAVPSIETIVVKNTVNGIAVFLLGRLWTGLWPAATSPSTPSGPPGARPHLPLKTYFGRVTTLGVLVPALLTMLFVAGAVERANEVVQAHAMHTMARATAQTTDAVMQERVATLDLLASLLAQRGPLGAVQAQEVLGRVGASLPGFVSFVVADADGRLVASWPIDSTRTTLLARGRLSIADRPYFALARDSAHAIVSDVFRGRGFGQHAIIAVSAAIRDPSGRVTGVIEGSVRADQLGPVLTAAVPAKLTATILSPAGVIIYSGDSIRSPVLSRSDAVWPPLRSARSVLGPDSHGPVVTREVRAEPTSRFLDQTRLVVVAPSTLGWMVRLEQPYAQLQEAVRSVVLTVFIMSLLALVILRLASTRVLRDVLGPVQALRVAVQPDRWGAGDDRASNVASTLGPGVPLELVALAHGLDGLKAELRRTLAGLEHLVARRTKDLVAAVEEAQAASQAKTEFLATMSHELRTPLNTVIGRIDALREGVYGPLRPEQRNALDGMDVSAQHLLSLIDDILMASRLAAGRMPVGRERVDVRAVVERVGATMMPMANAAGVHLQIELPAGALTLDADPLRLQQVLINLVGNAVKFSRPGGSVSIRAETGLAPGRVRRLQVVDEGVGIPAAHLSAIFEPFVQASHGHSRTHGGSGLGLSISRGLCEAMGLALTVESVEGQGATFSIETRA